MSILKQERPCKHCGYVDIWSGNVIAMWFEPSFITREPINPLTCERCKKPMQIYQQDSHRRSYKCWDCGNFDVDNIFYENGTKPYSEMDPVSRWFHFPEEPLPWATEQDGGIAP